MDVFGRMLNYIKYVIHYAGFWKKIARTLDGAWPELNF